MSSQIEICNPVGVIPSRPSQTLVSLPNLAGRRVVVLDNAKPNFVLLARRITERLSEWGQPASVQFFRKSNPAVPARRELLDEISQVADVVITGSGD